VAYIILALAPSYLGALLHTANLLLAGTAAGELLLGAAVAQLLFRRWDATRAQIVGLCLLAAGLTGLVAAGFIANLSLLLATITIAGVGQGLAFMGATREATSLTAPGQRAETAAAFWVASYLGGGLPVIGVGLASTRFGLTHAVQAFAACLAVACLATLIVVRRR
jgi:sugar phosphate permease